MPSKKPDASVHSPTVEMLAKELASARKGGRPGKRAPQTATESLASAPAPGTDDGARQEGLRKTFASRSPHGTAADKEMPHAQSVERLRKELK